MIAQAATKILGQEFIPVNKPGGAGSGATGIVAHSKGDGYTLVAGPWPPLTSVPHLESVPYDPLKDIIPIIQFGFIYSGIIVPSDSPYNSLKELIDFSRRNPGKVSCGHSGVGTGTHLAMEYLIQQEKVNIIMVPFAAAAPAFVALLGGHVTVAVVGQGVFWPNLRAGKIKALASTADKRTKELPDTPTLLELGYPDGVFTESYIIAAPKGTPPAVVEKLEGTFRKIMKTEEYRNVADNFRIYLENPLSPQNLKDAIEKEYVKIGEVIRKTNLGK
jgi:tripartite-type tricarboxylate transporter receptor subunit TctC